MGQISYYKPVSDGESTCSVDMVRYSIKFRPQQFEDLQQRLDTAMCDERPDFWETRKIGQYRMLWVFRAGDTTISVGLGRNMPSGKIDTGCGFVEYNPNKCGNDRFTVWLLDALRRAGVRFQLKRYDLAIDIAIGRNELVLVKDARKYECVVKASATEYLGERNKPGRVKLYDKAKESGVESNLSRLEVTCSGDWGVPEIVAALPLVAKLPLVLRRDSGKPDLKMSLIAELLTDVARSGRSIEPYLVQLDRRDRYRIKKALEQVNVLIPPYAALGEIVERIRGCDIY